MGKEQPASYYDAAYKKAPEYSKHWKQSRYLKVWQRMLQRFDKKKRVLDFGCGVGQTASLMIDMGFDRYMGVDFSSQAIAMAKETHLVQPNYSFHVADVFEFASNIPQVEPESEQIFCSETLEHIQRDVELLQLIQQKFSGCRIAISVPTFDDPGHVRHFKSAQEAKARYSPFINVEDLSQIGPWIIIQGKLKS